MTEIPAETTKPAPEEQLRTREVTIVAQDPAVTDALGRIVRGRVSVPADWLEPGPRGQRFHVVDYDATAGVLNKPADLRDPSQPPSVRPWSFLDRFAAASDADLRHNPEFHAQNVYAIAARTLAAFEFALGRRLGWSFPSHQLYLVPHAFAEANAHYSAEDGGVFFGYLQAPGGETIYTCLSHDIVAHETTHAILDGLRPLFIEPGLPDQPAFHEAFADIVALLSIFSVPSLIESELGAADADGRISAAGVERATLAHSALFGLGEQFGEATSGVRGSALRRSLALKPNTRWRQDPAFEEPHRRGEIVVASLMRALTDMWTKRLKALIYARRLDRERAAEEGAKAAEHLLRIAIRAIDYAPAVELEFEDYLEGLLVSDQVVAPDDEHGYRHSIESAFKAFGILPQRRIVDLAGKSLLYAKLNFTALRSDRDEVFRFIWHNAQELELDRRYHLLVQSVRPSSRVAPDGLIVNEVVADYAQVLDLTPKQIASGDRREYGQIEVPAGLTDDTPLQMWGSGTLIFDQFGMAKFHQRKPLQDWTRQSRRLAYLARRGLFDRAGRLGFSLGTSRGVRFAEFHQLNTRAGEDW